MPPFCISLSPHTKNHLLSIKPTITFNTSPQMNSFPTLNRIRFYLMDHFSAFCGLWQLCGILQRKPSSGLHPILFFTLFPFFPLLFFFPPSPLPLPLIISFPSIPEHILPSGKSSQHRLCRSNHWHSSGKIQRLQEV